MKSYETFLAKSEAALLIIGEGKITWVNEAAIQLFKEPKEILIDRVIPLEQCILVYLKAGEAAANQAVVFHQLKAPLAITKWLIEDLLEEDGKLTSHQKEQLQDIYQTNQSLINLIADLLTATKLGGGVMKINPASTDIVRAIKDVIKMFKPAADRKKQKIILEAENLTAHLNPNLDPNLFSRAVENLLDNAISYGLENSEIKISVIFDVGQSQYVISAHNDGPAIPFAEKEKIFTKFYRAESAKKIKPSGTGLGLFIAKSAVEANGGKIWFESEEGRGTTFYFSQPI